MMAAPASVMPLELPACTLPSLRNTGGSFAIFSTVTPSRACSSSSNTHSPFFRSFNGTPTFYINDDKIRGVLTYDEMKKIIDKHIANAANPA